MKLKAPEGGGSDPLMRASHAPSTTPTRRQCQLSGKKTSEIPVIGGLHMLRWLPAAEAEDLRRAFETALDPLAPGGR
jgi:hypothetical protein